MIGTGIFTSLGYQLVYPFHGFEIVLLWVVGGILAVFGSLCYGSLAAYIPRSGGEVQFLSHIYGRPFGFSAGLISIVAGFSAPIAASAFALSSYLTQVLRPLAHGTDIFAFVSLPWFPKALAIFVLLCVTLGHHQETKQVQRWQNFFVMLKIAVILLLICIGVYYFIHSPHINRSSLYELVPDFANWHLWLSSAFALCLVYVAQAYSGWNAAVYIAEEMDNPRKNLPIALLAGTLTVVFISVAINAVFYFTVPREMIIGQKEVAFFAAKNWIGRGGGDFVAICISIGLISAVSSMVWTGGRVLAVLGTQFAWFFSLFSKENKNGRPCTALWFLFSISATLIATSSFQFIIELVGFSLTLCSALAVSGLFFLKRKSDKEAEANFKDPFYPVSAIVYVGFCVFILASAAFASPLSFAASFGLFFTGLVLGQINEMRTVKSENPAPLENTVSEAARYEETQSSPRFPILASDRARGLLARPLKMNKNISINP